MAIREYVEIKYSVSEAKFKAWPQTLRAPFEALRTVTPKAASLCCVAWTRLGRASDERCLLLHPAAELFPVMDEVAFAALVADIAAQGQREPILILDGQVIDGRHRLRACEQAGLEPVVREVSADEGDPFGLVVSLNLHRRHLTESQRAMVAARLARLPYGQ